MESAPQNNKKAISFIQVIHSIKNLLELTAEEKEFIKTLTDHEKMEIILEYDKTLQAFIKVYEDV